jgi:hypothetical protein
MSVVELPYVSIRFESPMVILIYKQGTFLDVPKIKETVACAEKLSEGKPYVTFSDLREEMNMSEEATKFVGNPANMPFFRGAAVLVRTGLYSFAINSISFFRKKTYPVRAFVTEERAMDWLRSLPLNAQTHFTY